MTAQFQQRGKYLIIIDKQVVAQIEARTRTEALQIAKARLEKLTGQKKETLA